MLFQSFTKLCGLGGSRLFPGGRDIQTGSTNQRNRSHSQDRSKQIKRAGKKHGSVAAQAFEYVLKVVARPLPCFGASESGVNARAGLRNYLENCNFNLYNHPLHNL